MTYSIMFRKNFGMSSKFYKTVEICLSRYSYTGKWVIPFPMPQATFLKIITLITTVWMIVLRIALYIIMYSYTYNINYKLINSKHKILDLTFYI